MERNLYEHECKYYETDQMGIIHHSNYIRFMEEARIAFLKQIGFPMEKIEADGLVCPVVNVSCDYKKMSYFADVLCIRVTVKEYRGLKLILGYEMTEKSTGEVRATATSTHCFMKKDGSLAVLKKAIPELDLILRDLAE